MQPQASAVLRGRGFAITAAGVFLTLLGVLSLSGPGRIDIVDGQTRYEVARSLVDHRDTIIRNPQVWFGVFPGRDGTAQTTYRFPQSLLGVVAVVAADATGPRSEARRHFFFALTSAAAGAALATVYFWWFSCTGLRRSRAILWASAGIFATPSWFYSTSTFDDILGALAVTAAIAVAAAGRGSGRSAPALLSGLLVGLAFNCKQPLAVFGLGAVAAADERHLPGRARLLRFVLVCLGVAVGIGIYAAFDAFKFPSGTKNAHGPLLARYIAVYPGHFPLSLLLLLASPACGVFWYHPGLLLSVEGMRAQWLAERRFVMAMAASAAAFLVFIATMSIFKGDPAWGPRYLTPVFAALWLFAPSSARRLKRFDVTWLLVLGLLVQLLALAVDPHRLYVKHGLPSAFGAAVPMLYTVSTYSHLLMRPGEIRDVWLARHEPGERFSPSPSPTFAFPIINEVERGETAIRKYKLLNSFRPWWASLRYLPVEQRPVSLRYAAAVFMGMIVTGGGLLAAGCCMRGPPDEGGNPAGRNES